MVKKPRRVLWDKAVYTDLQKVYNRIKNDSLTTAEKVRDGILMITQRLPENPEKYPPDKFKKDNKGDFRAFEKYSYRIAYKITDEEIVILRLRQVKQEPKEY